MEKSNHEQIEIVEGSPFRQLGSKNYQIVIAISFLTGLFHLYTMLIYPIDPWVLRGIHLAMATVLILFFYKPNRTSGDQVSLIDIILAVLSVIPAIYIAMNLEGLLSRYGVSPTTWDIVWGLVVVLTLLEVTRRTTGWALPIIAAIFIVYTFVGPYMPGELWHRGYDVSRFTSILFSADAIYSTPLGVSATYVFIFILFGSFLEVSGGTKFFIDLAYAMTGKRRGGPAKVALFSSAFMGTVSGSAVANVVTTGAFSIPLMKKVGYSPRFAAAVEAVSSTGGQIMPPVMGAGAFIMADLTGIPYTTIALAAVIPAILYFSSVFWMVDFEAAKLGLVPKSDEEIPKVKEVLKTGIHLLIPLAVLIFTLIVLGYSPLKAGIYGIASAIVLSWFNKAKENRLGIKQIYFAIAGGFKDTISIAATCATAGIIIGVFSLTGLGAKLSELILSLSMGNMALALFFTMLVCLLLGMGLPTVAAYAIAASTVGPSLTAMGIQPLAAHLFILYFASISTITPPVALSAFAGAAIAGADPMKVGLTSVKLGLTAFLVPYLFIMGPELLMEGDLLHIVWATITASFGVYLLAAALQGWLFVKSTLLERVLSFIAALCFMTVGLMTDIIGLLITFILLYSNHLRKKKLEQEGSYKIDMSIDDGGNIIG